MKCLSCQKLNDIISLFDIFSQQKEEKSSLLGYFSLIIFLASSIWAACSTHSSYFTHYISTTDNKQCHCEFPVQMNISVGHNSYNSLVYLGIAPLLEKNQALLPTFTLNPVVFYVNSTYYPYMAPEGLCKITNSFGNETTMTMGYVFINSILGKQKCFVLLPKTFPSLMIHNIFNLSPALNHFNSTFKVENVLCHPFKIKNDDTSICIPTNNDTKSVAEISFYYTISYFGVHQEIKPENQVQIFKTEILRNCLNPTCIQYYNQSELFMQYLTHFWTYFATFYAIVRIFFFVIIPCKNNFCCLSIFQRKPYYIQL